MHPFLGRSGQGAGGSRSCPARPRAPGEVTALSRQNTNITKQDKTLPARQEGPSGGRAWSTPIDSIPKGHEYRGISPAMFAEPDLVQPSLPHWLAALQEHSQPGCCLCPDPCHHPASGEPRARPQLRRGLQVIQVLSTAWASGGSLPKHRRPLQPWVFLAWDPSHRTATPFW